MLHTKNVLCLHFDQNICMKPNAASVMKPKLLYVKLYDLGCFRAIDIRTRLTSEAPTKIRQFATNAKFVDFSHRLYT